MAGAGKRFQRPVKVRFYHSPIVPPSSAGRKQLGIDQGAWRKHAMWPEPRFLSYPQPTPGFYTEESSKMPEGQASLVRRILVANRGEIAIRVFRSSHELGLRTVAIYSHEDRFALHRFKADEAYRVGKTGEPIRAYLDIAGIIELARQHEVNAIHPGYGFLSENPAFAHACHAAGLIFVGPRTDILERLGDKIAARKIALEAGVSVLPGSTAPIQSIAEARTAARKLGYP